MKRIIALLIVSIALVALGSEELFFDGLNDAQRYDLADAYNRVADRYAELDDAERAAAFRAMVGMIYPGFESAARPETPAEPVVVRPPETPATDPAGGDASFYYFNKLLRGVFNENVSLTVSVIAETLYLPLYDSGIDRAVVSSELEWFFDTYEVDRVVPDDVFDMRSIAVTPLDNGYWRLDVNTWPDFADAVPEVTFWSRKMGFYFRKYPEGWRLAAIGPTA